MIDNPFDILLNLGTRSKEPRPLGIVCKAELIRMCWNITSNASVTIQMPLSSDLCLPGTPTSAANIITLLVDLDIHVLDMFAKVDRRAYSREPSTDRHDAYSSLSTDRLLKKLRESSSMSCFSGGSSSSSALRLLLVVGA